MQPPPPPKKKKKKKKKNPTTTNNQEITKKQKQNKKQSNKKEQQNNKQANLKTKSDISKILKAYHHRLLTYLWLNKILTEKTYICFVTVYTPTMFHFWQY